MIWIIGDKGMLGAELSEVMNEAGLAFIGSDRECDIADIENLRAFGEGKAFKWIVNCSAYTAVDKAEDEEDLARRINALGAENIAMYAKESGARMIHLSTDYVFSGTASRPYLENDPIEPVDAYGRTKAEGEALIREALSEHFIIRTAWLYGRFGGNFVATMLRLMAEKPEIGVVADQIGSPTWARDLSLAILRIIESDSKAFGTYHFTDEGSISWFDFAKEIQALGIEFGKLSKTVPIKSLTTAQYPTKAKRPAYSVLSKEKIKSVLGCEVPEWKESLRRYFEIISSK
jgi:dTDP-4-dehydrorhamnose reductase